MFGGAPEATVVPPEAVADPNAKFVPMVSLRGTIQDKPESTGLMGGSHNGISFKEHKPLIDEAFNQERAVAVVLMINSPGGSPVQTSLLADHIRTRAAETKLPVYAFVEDMAASGGYWLACAADEIYIDPNSMLGSIGVITQSLCAADLMKNIGVEPRIITTGKNKAALNPMLKMDDEQRGLLKESMTVVHTCFIDWVKERRPKLQKDNKMLFSGRVFTGEQAVKLGLADGVSTIHEVLQKKFPDKTDALTIYEIPKKNDGGIMSLITSLFERSESAMDTLSNCLDAVRHSSHPDRFQ